MVEETAGLESLEAQLVELREGIKEANARLSRLIGLTVSVNELLTSLEQTAYRNGDIYD